MRQGAMLNSYPDSLGKNLSEAVEFLSLPEMKDVFQSIYLLPSVFNSDIDRGYSVISYDLASGVASEEDFEKLREMGFDMVFDFILNHLSVLSPEFRDVVEKGDASPYRDFFLDWNKFWEGCGEKNEDGVIMPDPEKWPGMRGRKEGKPVLMVRFPDGSEVPFWNTFFQEVIYRKVDQFDLFDLVGGKYTVACALAKHINDSLDQGLTPKTIDWTGYEACKDDVIELLESRRRYLGQIDVNLKNPMVWEWFDTVMKKLAGLGASLLRLDTVFSLLKDQTRLFPADCPENWELLGKLSQMAAKYGLEVIPEAHVAHKTGAHRRQWEMGVPTYDYFLPILLIDATERGDSEWVYKWAKEQIDAGGFCINMLGCHDGIPIRDPRGALPDDLVDLLDDKLFARGGRRRYTHTMRANEIYQMDISYYSALDCNDKRMAIARAVHVFMPGKPQVWYQDLLAGPNDLEIFERVPESDNREINRHNYTLDEIKENLKRPVVQEQLRLLKIRNTHPAFAKDSIVTAERPDENTVILKWEKDGAKIALEANFKTLEYRIW